MNNRYNRLHARKTGGWEIHIKGKLYNVHFARIVFKCEECFSDLRLRNHGLVCTANEEHRGFIHRKNVEQLRAERAKNVEVLKEIYEIKDGKIVVKGAK